MPDAPPISPLLFYRDPKAALDFLERAFGFETRLVVETEAGGVMHSESAFEGHVVMVVGPPSHSAASPLDLGGRVTGHVHVQLREGIDALCERARAAGARIGREPEDQPYGDRVFTCLDPEGQSWSFGQKVEAVPPAEQARRSGAARGSAP
jgi:uncharacterized glyoxalase superfamily protein PhnB